MSPSRFHALTLVVSLLLPVAAWGQSSPQDNWTLERTITGGSSNGLFNNPAAVAVAPDGSILVADTGNYRIQVFTATGEFVRRFGSQGTGNGQFGSGMYTSGPTGVAVTSEGLIVVADSGNSRIEVFQSDGTFVRTFGSVGVGDGQFSNSSQLKLAVTSDGKIVVGDSVNNRVQVFGIDGSFSRKFGSSGGFDSQFFVLAALATSPDGQIVTVDKQANRVQVFAADGTFIRKFGSGGTGDGQLQSPNAVTVLPDGTIAVLDTSNSRVQLFDSSGSFIRKFGTAGSANGQFSTSLGLAGTASGQLIIADTGNSRVQVIGSDGTFVRAFGSYGAAIDGFGSYVAGIAVATDGTLYVADNDNSRIQVFSAGGQFLRFLSGYPNSLSPGLNGNLVVGYYGYADVLTSTGTKVVRIGSTSTGTVDGQFGAAGVSAVVDPATGDIYVTDAGNSRVQVFDAAGNFLRKFGEIGTGPGQLNGLGGIGLTPEGKVAVFSTISPYYLQYFTKQGAFIERRALPSYYNFPLRSVGPDGLLYFAGAGASNSSSYVYNPQLAQVASFSGGAVGLYPRTGALYTYDGTNRVVSVWRRGFRTLGANPAKLVPMPAVVATAQRSGTGIVDIDYSVTDGDSSTVTVGIAAFKSGSAAIRDLIAVRAANTIESTAANLGAAQPTGLVRRVSWDASAAQVQSTNLAFEVFARDDRPGLLDFDFITLPSSPALTISRIPVSNDDLRAVWAWLLLQGDPALSRGSDGEVVGPTGTFTSTSTDTVYAVNYAPSTVYTTHTTAVGRAWLFAKLGVREATTTEVQTARQGTATGSPNQFTPTRSQQMGARPQAVNEWTFDSSTSYPTESWWVVPVAQ